jgi:AcrR family transcriptional regulator
MGRRPRFDERDLAAAGLRVVAQQGWQAVSVASVATSLSVTPMALYRVARDAEHLRRIIADSAAEHIQPVEPGGPLLSSLREWAVDAYRHLAPLTGLATYVIHEWTELPRWLAVVDTLLGIADDEGITGTEAVLTVNAVFSYVLARAQMLDSVNPLRRLQPLEDLPNRFPHIRAELQDFRTARTDAAFRFGLDALCRGLPDVQSRAIPRPAT